MKEELGIEPSETLFLYKYRHSNDYESEYVSTFKSIWDGPIQTNPEEIEEGRFWTLSEIEQSAESGRFTPNFLDELKRYIEFSTANQEKR